MSITLLILVLTKTIFGLLQDSSQLPNSSYNNLFKCYKLGLEAKWVRNQLKTQEAGSL